MVHCSIETTESKCNQLFFFLEILSIAYQKDVGIFCPLAAYLNNDMHSYYLSYENFSNNAGSK